MRFRYALATGPVPGVAPVVRHGGCRRRPVQARSVSGAPSRGAGVSDRFRDVGNDLEIAGVLPEFVNLRAKLVPERADDLRPGSVAADRFPEEVSREAAEPSVRSPNSRSQTIDLDPNCRELCRCGGVSERLLDRLEARGIEPERLGRKPPGMTIGCRRSTLSIARGASTKAVSMSAIRSASSRAVANVGAPSSWASARQRTRIAETCRARRCGRGRSPIGSRPLEHGPAS